FNEPPNIRARPEGSSSSGLSCLSVPFPLPVPPLPPGPPGLSGSVTRALPPVLLLPPPARSTSGARGERSSSFAAPGEGRTPGPARSPGRAAAGNLASRPDRQQREARELEERGRVEPDRDREDQGDGHRRPQHRRGRRSFPFARG